MRILFLIFAIILASCQLGKSSLRTKNYHPATYDKGTTDGDDFNPEDAKIIADLFMGLSRLRGSQSGNHWRPVFLKPHACAKAEFQVLDSIDESLKVGLFGQSKVYSDVMVRISSDTTPNTSDFDNKTIGFAIKIRESHNAMQEEENLSEYDFLLQNHNVFFVDTAKQFREFTCAVFQNNFQVFAGRIPSTPLEQECNTKWNTTQFFAAYSDTAFKSNLDAMAKPVANILNENFWSVTPYKLGESQFTKYKLTPCNETVFEPTSMPDDPSQVHYLKPRIHNNLLEKEACFELQVQTKVGDMPLDQASIEWSEETSVPKTVARLIIPKQDINDNIGLCEELSYTVWNTHEDNAPVGSVNKARRVAYPQSAEDRIRRRHPN